MFEWWKITQILTKMTPNTACTWRPESYHLPDKIFILLAKFECLHEMATEGSREQRVGTGNREKMTGCKIMNRRPAALLNFYGLEFYLIVYSRS